MIGGTGCQDTLGMENEVIVNDQLTASSFYPGKEAWKARLNNVEYWAPATAEPTDAWIQVDLLRGTKVTHLITQGSGNDYQKWVKELQVQYGFSPDELMYISEAGEPKVSTTATSFYSSFSVHVK